MCEGEVKSAKCECFLVAAHLSKSGKVSFVNS